MKFKVYHAKEPNFRDDDEGLIEFNEDNFELVAEVECPADQYGDVFRLTNHIDEAWWENPEVTCIKQSRSTSVGDMMVAADGVRFRCMGIGWGTF